MRQRKLGIAVVFGLVLLLSSCQSDSSFTTVAGSSVSLNSPVGLISGSYPGPTPSPTATSGSTNSGSYPGPSPSPSSTSSSGSNVGSYPAPSSSPSPSVSVSPVPSPSSGSNPGKGHGGGNPNPNPNPSPSSSSGSGGNPAPSPSSTSGVGGGEGGSPAPSPSSGAGGYPVPNPSSSSGAGDYPVPSPSPSSSSSASGPYSSGDYCSYTQGGWGSVPHGGNPGAILQAAFPSAFPQGVTVGISSGSGFSMHFTSSVAIMNYLPAGGTPAALDSDLVDPISSSAGVFGGQVLTLYLNVALNQAGVIRGSAGNLGDLKLSGTGGSLDGMTVSQILQVAETALGGGSLPSGYSISGLNDVVTGFNEAFDACQPSSWAQSHIGQ